jgi:hypothetical protein
MCDNKDLLVGYLYDDLAPEERVAFDAHMRACADCRDEVVGLRSTRGSLAAWAPPEPDLGFQVVRHVVEPRGKVVPFRMRWKPVFGLAAAAVLVLAVASAIANVEVRYDNDGLVIRTGWAPSQAAPVQTSAPTNAAQPERVNANAVTADFAAVEQRLRALEASLPAEPVRASARMTDAEMLRQVRAIVRDAESRQEGAVAQRLLQLWQDFDKVRRAEIAMLQQGTAQYQGVTNAELARLGQELRVKHLEK